MLLFGYLTKHEIEREIDNCNSFLDVFYQDSYMIKLKKRQKVDFMTSSNRFAISEPSSGQKTSPIGTISSKVSSNLELPG